MLQLLFTAKRASVSKPYSTPVCILDLQSISCSIITVLTYIAFVRRQGESELLKAYAKYNLKPTKQINKAFVNKLQSRQDGTAEANDYVSLQQSSLLAYSMELSLHLASHMTECFGSPLRCLDNVNISFL